MVPAEPADQAEMPRYDHVTAAFHWISAVLVLILLFTGLVMEHLAPLAESARDGIVQFHILLGAAGFLVNIVRCFWRISHKHPAPAAFRTPREAMIGDVVHGIMYVLIIIVPLAGWAYVTVAGYALQEGDAALGVPLPDMPLPSAMADGADGFAAVHDYGAWLLLALAALHITAAIIHHLRAPADQLMDRIWFRRSASSKVAPDNG